MAGAKGGLTKDQILALAAEGAAHRQEVRSAPAPMDASVPAEPKTRGLDRKPSPVIVHERVSHIGEMISYSRRGEPESRYPTPEPPAEMPAFDLEMMSELDRESLGLPRIRRVGLRSDRAWTQKTMYLRHTTVKAAVALAKTLGLEFSELVDFSLGIQVQTETMDPKLAELFERLHR